MIVVIWLIYAPEMMGPASSCNLAMELVDGAPAFGDLVFSLLEYNNNNMLVSSGRMSEKCMRECEKTHTSIEDLSQLRS